MDETWPKTGQTDICEIDFCTRHTVLLNTTVPALLLSALTIYFSMNQDVDLDIKLIMGPSASLRDIDRQTER